MNDTAVPVRLGMLTPSSNTVLEPFTTAMLGAVQDVTAHFARFKVLKISMDKDSLGQFKRDPMLEAASFLADAQVQSICWNGTSSGWLGFESDYLLLRQIEKRTGVTACSSVLAINEILEKTGVKRIAFVTPYLHEIQTRIVANYQTAGFEVVAERHLNDVGNYSFATYSSTQIQKMCLEVAAERPQAIAIFCTNFRGAEIAQQIETETGIMVVDSVSAALWKSMLVAGANPALIKGWGQLFDV